MPERHKVVSHDKWLEVRGRFLSKEKAFTRQRDRLSRERRNLPWERVDKTYVFKGPDGKQTLAQLFEGRRQLVVYHFMFAPEWDAGCTHCSFWADKFDDQIIHLAHPDVTMVAISRAPYRIQDPGATDQPGVSVFYKGPRSALFHTYSTYARGIDTLNTAYNYLDLVPKGLDEAGPDFLMFWVRRRDEYDR